MANLTEHLEHILRETVGTDEVGADLFKTAEVLAFPAHTRAIRRLRQKEEAGGTVNTGERLAAVLALVFDSGTLLIPAVIAVANLGLGAAAFSTRITTYNLAVHGAFEFTERRR